MIWLATRDIMSDVEDDTNLFQDGETPNSSILLILMVKDRLVISRAGYPLLFKPISAMMIQILIHVSMTMNLIWKCSRKSITREVKPQWNADLAMVMS